MLSHDIRSRDLKLVNAIIPTDPEKVEVWLPRGGVSIIGTPGRVFSDEEVDPLLVETIKKGLRGTVLE